MIREKLNQLKLIRIHKIENDWSGGSNQEEANSGQIKATRKNLQLSRRLFHMSTGVTVATTYVLTFTHNQLVHILGILACLMYLLEQIRVKYPRLARKFYLISKYLLRAEEQLKESAAMPYTMAIFLTILSFPKEVSIASIYTLALADPIAAIIGIKFGKYKIVENKSLEGSCAFFLVSFLCIALTFLWLDITGMRMWMASLMTALIITIVEMLPSRLDDNLIIPLSTASILWISCILLSIGI